MSDETSAETGGAEIAENIWADATDQGRRASHDINDIRPGSAAESGPAQDCGTTIGADRGDGSGNVESGGTACAWNQRNETCAVGESESRDLLGHVGRAANQTQIAAGDSHGAVPRSVGDVSKGVTSKTAAEQAGTVVQGERATLVQSVGREVQAGGGVVEQGCALADAEGAGGAETGGRGAIAIQRPSAGADLVDAETAYWEQTVKDTAIAGIGVVIADPDGAARVQTGVLHHALSN